MAENEYGSGQYRVFIRSMRFRNFQVNRKSFAGGVRIFTVGSSVNIVTKSGIEPVFTAARMVTTETTAPRQSTSLIS
jgi:hypothetical protein